MTYLRPVAPPTSPPVSYCPDMGGAWQFGVTENFGERLADPPLAVPQAGWACTSPAEVKITIAGVEPVTTTLGVFQAIRVDGTQGYDVNGVTDRNGRFIKHIQDEYRASEWWVCGYGLVRVSATHVYDDVELPRREQHSEVRLVSATR